MAKRWWGSAPDRQNVIFYPREWRLQFHPRCFVLSFGGAYGLDGSGRVCRTWFKVWWPFRKPRPQPLP